MYSQSKSFKMYYNISYKFYLSNIKVSKKTWTQFFFISDKGSNFNIVGYLMEK